MSVRVNVHMSKIMRTPIKVGIRTYVTNVNCRTLRSKEVLGNNNNKKDFLEKQPVTVIIT